MIKVFTQNERGHIEFTVAELEKLLKESYDEGYAKAKAENPYCYPNSNLTPNGVILRDLSNPIYNSDVSKSKTTERVYSKACDTVRDAFSTLKKELSNV